MIFRSAMLFILVSSPLLGRDFYIDFGAEAMKTGRDAENGVWNNAVWEGPGHRIPLKLVDRDGRRSSITLQRVGGFLGAFSSGVNPQDLYPDSVGSDRWALEAGRATEGTLRLSGLPINSPIDLKFFGTRSAPLPFPMVFKAAGRSATLDARNNRERKAVIPNLMTSDGNLEISVGLAGGNNGHLCAMEIHLKEQNAAPAPSPVPPFKPAPVKTPKKSVPDIDPKQSEELAELGLVDDGGGNVLFFIGLGMSFLGLLTLGGSVWFYFKS